LCRGRTGAHRHRCHARGGSRVRRAARSHCLTGELASPLRYDSRAGTETRTRRRMRQALVASQVSLAPRHARGRRAS
jgi:hypothetical protein